MLDQRVRPGRPGSRPPGLRHDRPGPVGRNEHDRRTRRAGGPCRHPDRRSLRGHVRRDRRSRRARSETAHRQGPVGGCRHARLPGGDAVLPGGLFSPFGQRAGPSGARPCLDPDLPLLRRRKRHRARHHRQYRTHVAGALRRAGKDGARRRSPVRHQRRPLRQPVRALAAAGNGLPGEGRRCLGAAAARGGNPRGQGQHAGGRAFQSADRSPRHGARSDRARRPADSCRGQSDQVRERRAAQAGFPPLLGENTRDVLADVLGLDEEEIAAALAAGVVGEPRTRED